MRGVEIPLATTNGMGVVSGIVMSYQFGTNWSYYSHYVGDVFGAPLAIDNGVPASKAAMLIQAYTAGGLVAKVGFAVLADRVRSAPEMAGADLAVAESLWEAVSAGPGLIHGDVRSDNVLLHDDGWRFLTIGRCLERVDMTARLLTALALSWAIHTVLPDLGETRGTVAVRMPHDPVALELLGRTGPLAVSSANRSGQPAAQTAAAAREQLAESVEVYLDEGLRPLSASAAADGPEAAAGLPSTIVDCTGERLRVVRQGALALDARDIVLLEREPDRRLQVALEGEVDIALIQHHRAVHAACCRECQAQAARPVRDRAGPGEA